ncbi:MAG: [protein-PII] uridylyltransferase [Betaproteobacteria bacterium]|nr:[protein-PII] uridylyltransferase [Betaproteobacteria bacterium]
MVAAAELGELRQSYRAAVESSVEQFKSSRNPDRLLAALCRATDRLLRTLWQTCEVPARFSLAAIGGYGRGELFPHSDVDLLIIADHPDKGETAILERFISACWDLGLQIGHSVRSVDECLDEARGDITVQTSLIERRLLTGKREPFDQLGKRLEHELDPSLFFSKKLLEMRQRHTRYEDTPYSLEPNSKESPGGLRDLQLILWISRAAGLGATWADLARGNLISEAELRQIRHNERMLKRIRASLHVVSGRREDRLVFDLQAQVSAALGFGGADARQASESLMQRYYWAAKAVVQLSSLLIQDLRERLSPPATGEPEPLDAEFVNRGGLLDIVDPALFEHDPSAILRAFLMLTRHRELHGMSALTLRAIWRARTRIDADFRKSPKNRLLFLEFLQADHGVTRGLRQMNQWSVLGRYLPVFRRIVGQMQHDLFHVYTVDQHILMVVRNLRRFAMAEHAHEYPFCSQLMSSVRSPWLLVVAALFHDIAKGRGGDHSSLGRLDARRFCQAHGVVDTDRDLVEFLVEHHLTMSSIAQKQDLSDPEVIGRFSELVQSEERLTCLYLLTVADIRGTSPKVWNAWKAKLLEDLYRATRRHLAGEAPNAGAMLDSRRTEAVRLLNLQAIDPERYNGFWTRLGISYFLRTDPVDIAWHARVLAGPARRDGAIVRARMAPIGEGFQVVVYTRDQTELFARICGYFDSHNLSVLDAQIHTTPDGDALDSFLVVDPHAQMGYRERLSLVERELEDALRGPGALPAPVRGRLSRRSRYFPVTPTVDLRPDERGGRHLLSITANDRTGLLYSVARVMSRHQVSLVSARIMTLGERVEDVLVVQGPVFSQPRGMLEFESELLTALN